MIVIRKLDISNIHGYIVKTFFTSVFAISAWPIFSEISQYFWDFFRHILLEVECLRVFGTIWFSLILTCLPLVPLEVVIHFFGDIKLHSKVRGCNILDIVESLVQSGCLLHVAD